MSKKKRVSGNDSSDDEIENLDMDAMVDSEEELSDNERKLLKKIRQKRQKDNYDSEDEVMGFDDENEDEDEDEKDSMESDIDRSEGNDYLPNEKAWGKKKRDYYSTDYVDPDYASASQKDIADAELEEQEARNLQKRIADELDEADFGLDLVVTKEDVSEFDKDEHIKTDLSKLSKRQKQELFEKESPEFKPLVNDFLERLSEMKTILGPFMNLVENSNCPDCSAINFIKTKYNLLLHYCTNISFYLMLKSEREPVASHPVIKRLAQYRQLLSQLEDRQGNLLDRVTKILEANKNGEPLYNSVEEISSVNKTNESIKLGKSEKKNKKKVAFEDLNSDGEDNEETEKLGSDHLENNEDNQEIEDGAEKRAITYQIAKNRGLTPYRKKELRNPRVKHRNKYRKAIIRRKGAIRPVRKEVTKYDGEISGIKASVKKSIKLK